VLPPVTNGSIVKPSDAAAGTTLKHGSTLQYDCGEGFHAGTATTTCCHNGTWLTTPVCLPGRSALSVVRVQSMCVCVCVSASGRYCLTQMTRHICFGIVSVRKKIKKTKLYYFGYILRKEGCCLEKSSRHKGKPRARREDSITK